MTYRQHLRAVLVLGLPLAGSQLAQMSLSLVDAVMLGWYDSTAFAAETLAGSLFMVLFIAGTGFAAALTPLVSAAEARGEHGTARRVTRMSMWLSMLTGLVCLPILHSAEPIFLALGQRADIAALGGEYLRILSWSIFPALATMVLRSHLAAMEKTRVVLLAMLVAVLVNGGLNYLLIFGRLGFPEMGIRGAAIASLAMHFATLLFLSVYVQRRLPEQELFVRVWRPDWDAFFEVFRLGWPIGLTLVAEVGLFWATSVMMGWLGEAPLVAHGIVMQITSFTFMIHLGVSQAAAVRAGRALGRGTMTDLARGAKMAVVLSVGAVAVTVVCFVALPDQLIGLFIGPDEPGRAAVLAVGRGFLMASAAFQLVDAMQVMGLGLLRGLGDTQRPMLYAGFSYWGVAVPAALLLGFALDWQGIGIWLGLALGLATAAVLMMRRFWLDVLPTLTAEVHARLGLTPRQPS